MTTLLRRSLYLAWLLLSPAWCWAQFDLAWSRSTADQTGVHLAMDQADNVFSVGYHNFGHATVMKYDAAGTLLWTRSITGTSAARAVWVATDAAGNAWVLANHVSASSGNPFGIILTKFAADGTQLWQDSVTSTLAYGLRVLTDAQGNGYVFGSLPPLDGDTSFNVFYKYAADGTRLWRAPQDMRSPLSTKLDASGRLLVSGYAAGAFMVNEVFDTSDGRQLFAASVPSASGGTDIVGTPDGGFVSVGQAPSGPTGSVYEFLVVRYDAAFREVWRRTYDVGDRALKVGVDGAGNVFVTGFVGIYFDWMTIKLDPDGNELWSRRVNTHLYNDELPNWLLVQPDGSVVVAGQSGPGPTSGNLSYVQAGLSRYLGEDGASAGWFNDSSGSRALVVQRGGSGSLFVQASGQQTVYRVAQDGTGTISVDNWPIARAAATTATTGQAPLSVGFTADGSMDPDLTPVTLLWNFGDGSTSTSATPTHVYTAAGTYQATLTVTDLVGHAVSATPITIQVSKAAVPVQPTAIQLPATSIKGGSSLVGTLVVNGVGGAIVSMRSSSRLLTVPATVNVPPTSDRVFFNITTRPVRRDTPVKITAWANGASISTTLTLTP